MLMSLGTGVFGHRARWKNENVKERPDSILIGTESVRIYS